MGLLIAVAIILFAAWHTTKHGVPRAFRATAAARRRSIDGWTAEHPDAPKSARWLAKAGYGATALRHGPRYARREFAAAWQEGKERGRAKFRPEDFNQPTGSDSSEPALHQTTCNGCGATSGPGDKAAVEAWKGAHTCPPPQDSPKPQRRPDGRPDLRPVPDATPAGSTPTPDTAAIRSDDMAIQTATGGEITNAEQFAAEAKAIETEAAAELEDAAGDSGRAQEDLARIEKMIASLSKQEAVQRDIAAVAALKEPAAARAQAAKDRHAAAERRLAEAKNVTAIAARHVQMIGQAAGPFYNPR